MVPQFEKFLYPFLNVLKDKDVTKREMVEELRVFFCMSDQDMNARTKSGSVTQFIDRVGWTLQYLRRALFVDIKDGRYHITQRGTDYLNSHNSLLITDLLDYKEFAEYSNRKKPKKEKAHIIQVSTAIEQTPTELLEQAFESIERDLEEDLLDKVKNQSPVFFEHLVVDLLVAMGYGGSSKDAALVTQYSKDDGIDGIIKEDKLGLDNIYVQAKRWTNQVSKPQIQQFAGALDEKKASKGVFITTSSFSKDARIYVSNLSKKIVLIDGQELANYMIEYNVGVSVKKVYSVKKIDSDYFDE